MCVCVCVFILIQSAHEYMPFAIEKIVLQNMHSI